MGDCAGGYRPSWYLTKPPRPTQPGHPTVVGEMSILAMVTAVAGVANGEFCVTVGLYAKLAGLFLLAYLRNWLKAPAVNLLS